MGVYRHNGDGITASIVNYIISVVLFITGTVFFIFNWNGLYEYTALYAIFWGLGLANLATVKNVYKDYDMSNKFVRAILTVASILGVLLILAGAGVSISSAFPFVKVLGFSVLLGGLLKIFIANVNDFIPAFEAPKGDFFAYYSLLIFIASTLGFFTILYFFFNFYFSLMFVGNWILVYFILTDFRSWMEEKKTSYLVYAIIFFVIGVGVNLPIALAVNGLSSASFNIKEANLFNLASNLFFALALVMGIGFSFLTRLNYVKYNMSDIAIEILLLVIPGLAFGVQFLAFNYFKAFLIVAGSVLALVLLVVLLFKIFVKIIFAIGNFFGEAGRAIWYVISFKWITNQVSVLSSSDSSKSNKSKKPSTTSEKGCTDCHGCAYHTIGESPTTGMANCDLCLLSNEVLSYGKMLTGCENFKKR